MMLHTAYTVSHAHTLSYIAAHPVESWLAFDKESGITDLEYQEQTEGEST